MLHWLKKLIVAQRTCGPFSEDARLDSLRYVVVDTELTSLDARSNRVLSIGAIAMDAHRIRIGEQFYRVLNPGVPVPAETVVIHGLRPVDVMEGKLPEQAVAEFLEFAAGAALVGHFLSTDLAALKKEMPESRRGFENPAIDTAQVQRWLDLRRAAYREDRGHHVESLDLASLAKRYGLEPLEAHHALYDAFVTAQLWQRLMQDLDSIGVRTLGELMRVGSASG
jgi:DNA polymerase III subunit epsilon